MHPACKQQPGVQLEGAQEHQVWGTMSKSQLCKVRKARSMSGVDANSVQTDIDIWYASVLRTLPAYADQACRLEAEADHMLMNEQV